MTAEAFRGLRVLVTGGGNLFNISGIEKDVTVNIADVRDEHSMRQLVRGKDVLFNLGGQTSHVDSMTDPDTDLEINCRAQLFILGVETMIHYPVPVHCQEGYARLVRVEPGGLELTERLAGEVLSLPLYPELIDREVDQVIDAVTGSATPVR